MFRYAAPLYIDMSKTVITRHPADEDGGPGGGEEREQEDFAKVFVGEVCCAPPFKVTVSQGMWR